MVSPLLFYNKYRNLLPITSFLPALSSVRAANTMVALLFLFEKINTDASHNED